MKVALLLFIFGTAFLVSAVPVDNGIIGLDGKVKEYPRFMQIPDSEGNLHDVDLEAEPDYELLNEIERNPANNLYLLFTRRNARLSQTLTMNNANSINNSNFNRNLPTVFIVHGWLGSRYNGINPTIRDAVLGRHDANVIVLDWSRLASSGYATAANGVPAVGRGLGQFCNFLSSTTGAPLSSFHLVGFSLGAHLVGNAGRELGGRVARVTGLDPAGPLWNYSANRIRPTDGVYVEAIHTDGGLGGLGIGSNVANADFYPNGGTSQPGCLMSLCNHERAWYLYAASVSHDHHVARQCSTSLQITWNTCTGSSFPMGNNNLGKSGSGMFRHNTGRSHPF